MLAFVAVLPAIDPTLAHACIKSLHPEIRARLLLVDNTETGRIAHVHRQGLAAIYESGRNLGVASSWNLGVKLMADHGADYLLILSQSIRFGRARGIDLLAKVEKRKPAWIAHSQFGWKCLVISAGTFAQVGRFDPIFHPAYREDTDFLYRMGRAGLPSPRENGGELMHVMVDATSAGDAETIGRGLVKVNFAENQRLYVRKWGGDQGDETFRRPYDDPDLDWTFVGSYDTYRQRRV